MIRLGRSAFWGIVGLLVGLFTSTAYVARHQDRGGIKHDRVPFIIIAAGFLGGISLGAKKERH